MSLPGGSHKLLTDVASAISLVKHVSRGAATFRVSPEGRASGCTIRGTRVHVWFHIIPLDGERLYEFFEIWEGRKHFDSRDHPKLQAVRPTSATQRARWGRAPQPTMENAGFLLELQ